MDAHRHGWSVVDFFVEADRPMMRQRCGCGAVRAIRAWDRSWQPPDEEAEARAEPVVPSPRRVEG